MVKFGRHKKFFVEHENPDAYLVPYNSIKPKLESDEYDIEEFEAQWRTYLEQARKQFDGSVRHLWGRVFAQLHAFEEARGAPPEKALVLFTEKVSSKAQVQELLDEFKSIHATSLINAEALRKLIKKFDKYHQKRQEQQTGCDLSSDNPLNNTGTTEKQQQQVQVVESLSCKLLPEVYASNFLVGLQGLQEGIELLRGELGLGQYYATTDPAGATKSKDTPQNNNHNNNTNATSSITERTASHSETMFLNLSRYDSEDPIMLEDSFRASSNSQGNTTNSFIPQLLAPPPEPELPQPDDFTFKMLSKSDRKDSHAEHMQLVDRRRQELLWLRQTVQTVSKRNLLHNLVAHRGFHSPNDRSDRRPIENSLQAYEIAWTSGIHLCECDIALTKDERLILAHDGDFRRLALDVSCEKSNKKVQDLTFQEIMSVALSSGVRPPLLLDVLQSAHAIGGQSQLIIEIKPGNREAASALARLFAQNPHLMAHCAVVMSFDSFAMHTLKEEMDALLGLTAEDQRNAPTGPGQAFAHSHRRCYSMGIFPVQLARSASIDGIPLSNSSKQQPQAIADQQQQQQATSKPNKFQRPKLLVLTVCETPRRDVELEVSVADEDFHKKIQSWTKRRLDGVYMQFEPQMLTPEGSRVLETLARRFFVGVWGHNGRDPDDYTTFSKLVTEGNVSFVNSDLPLEFFHQGTGHLSTVTQSQNSSVGSSEGSAF